MGEGPYFTFINWLFTAAGTVARWLFVANHILALRLHRNHLFNSLTHFLFLSHTCPLYLFISPSCSFVSRFPVFPPPYSVSFSILLAHLCHISQHTEIAHPSLLPFSLPFYSFSYAPYFFQFPPRYILYPSVSPSCSPSSSSSPFMYHPFFGLLTFNCVTIEPSWNSLEMELSYDSVQTSHSPTFPQLFSSGAWPVGLMEEWGKGQGSRKEIRAPS